MNYGEDWSDTATTGIDWLGRVVSSVVGGKTAERQLALQKDILSMGQAGDTKTPAFDFQAIAPYVAGGVVVTVLGVYLLTRKR